MIGSGLTIRDGEGAPSCLGEELSVKPGRMCDNIKKIGGAIIIIVIQKERYVLSMTIHDHPSATVILTDLLDLTRLAHPSPTDFLTRFLSVPFPSPGSLAPWLPINSPGLVSLICKYYMYGFIITLPTSYSSRFEIYRLSI